MLRRAFLTGCTVLCLTAMGQNSAQAAPKWVIFDVADSTLPVSGTVPVSINSRGQVVGYYGGNQGTRGFINQRRKPTTIVAVPASSTILLSNNIWNSAVGWAFSTSTSEYHGVFRVWTGQLITLDAGPTTPGASYDQGTLLTQLNDKGQATGIYYGVGGIAHGVYVDRTRLTRPVTTFDAPGAGRRNSDGTYASFITKDGSVIGYVVPASTGFIRSPNGSIATFPLPPSSVSGAVVSSANDALQVTGFVTDTSSRYISFVGDTKGNFTTFSAPGAASSPYRGTFAQGISATGTVVGYFEDTNKVVHAFTRDPAGNITVYDAPGAQSTAFNHIDSTTGKIVGTSIGQDNVTHGFVLTP